MVSERSELTCWSKWPVRPAVRRAAEKAGARWVKVPSSDRSVEITAYDTPVTAALKILEEVVRTPFATAQLPIGHPDRHG